MSKVSPVHFIRILIEDLKDQTFISDKDLHYSSVWRSEMIEIKGGRREKTIRLIFDTRSFPDWVTIIKITSLPLVSSINIIKRVNSS